MNYKMCKDMLASKDGFIKIITKGTMCSYFDITYILKGKQSVYVSPVMKPLQEKKIVIPKNSTEIKLRVFAKDVCNNWIQIYGRTFLTVPNICFSVIATTAYAACAEIPCNDKNNILDKIY